MDLIQPIVQRLRERCAALRAVNAAAAAVPAPAASPHAWVVPLAEAAEPALLISVHAQRVRITVGIEIVAREAGDAAGGLAWTQLQEARDQVVAALAGWKDADAGDAVEPLQFAGGRMLAVDPGQITWRDEFTGAYQLRIA